MKFIGLLRSAITVHFRAAGLICFTCGPWNLHICVPKKDRYDGPLPNYGLGPLFLLAAIDPDAWCYFCDTDRCEERMRHGWF